MNERGVEMDLSIIIPVYNTALEDLRRCFASLRFSESIAFEVIIVDDGSQNEASGFCREYAAAYPGFHYFWQKNQGVSAARNTGLSHACGRYVMFVDADDELIADTIHIRYLDGKYDLVFFDHEVREDNRVYTARVFDDAELATPAKKDFISAACRDKVNSAYARLYRRTLLLEHGIRFSENMVVAEDAAFVLAAILAAKHFCYVPSSAYRYFHSYENGNNRLMRFPRAVFDNAIQLYRMRSDALEHHDGAMAFTAAELEGLRADAAERLVRALFEAKGSLLVRGNAFDEMRSTVVPLAKELYQTYGKAFSPVTRLKCFLLKKDWKTVIRGYACLRELYIRMKK